MHSVELENRLLAVWEKTAKLELSVYDAMDWFVETRPISAPGDLRKMADGYLEIACELDAISRDLEAEVRTTQQRMSEWTHETPWRDRADVAQTRKVNW